MQLLEVLLNLNVGDWVEVKSVDEILATLDDNFCLNGLPFMPEMLQFCGRKFQVFKSAHKTADTIEQFTIRRMSNAVHLEGLRCDGSAHAGCEASCLLFWKDSWLKRVPSKQVAGSVNSNSAKAATLSVEEASKYGLLSRGAVPPTVAGAPQHYRCQATAIPAATTEVRRRDRLNPFFYVRDLTSGNVKLFDFIRFGALAMLNVFLRTWFKVSIPHVRGLVKGKTPTLNLGLKPGEMVRVRSKKEIMLTLNDKNRNRGLWFDAEMVVYCGKGPFRVLRRVEKILNEKTGAMITLPNPCIILEGVTCSGNFLAQRMFSPRNEYMFFHEIWLERVEQNGNRPVQTSTSA